MPTNLEYRARERQRKRESKQHASRTQWQKKQGDIFSLEEQHENFVAMVTKWEMLMLMRNAN